MPAILLRSSFLLWVMALMPSVSVLGPFLLT